MNKIRIAGAAAGVALVSGMVLQVSSAAFTGETSNNENAWDAGNVMLSGGEGSAMYSTATESNIVPGYSQTRCIEVTYDGTVTPSKAIDLYAATTSTPDPVGDGVADDLGDGLADDLRVSVRIGNEGTRCLGFSALNSTQILSATALDAFATASAPLSTTWRPDPGGILNLGLGADTTRAFEFTVTLPNTTQTDNDAQGDSATADFTWRATS